jgi:hypothetical protein
MTMKKYMMPLLGVALMASCERTIDFNGKASDPKLIVGAVIGPDARDNELTVRVAESVFLYGGQKPQPVTDATFRIRKNGVEVRKDVEVIDGVEKSHFYLPVTAGDRLELEGETPKHGKVRASDVVPFPADIRDLTTEWFQSDADGKWYLRTLVTFVDKPGERDYYRVRIKSETDYIQTFWSGDEWLTREDTHKQDHGSGYTDREMLMRNFGGDPVGGNDTWGQFSDELIDGQQYTLDLYIQLDRELPWGDFYTGSERPPLDPGVTPGYKTTAIRVTVEMHTISENLFRYLRSAELMNNGHNFSEPVKLFTNVEGGYGIFGAYNVASKTAEPPLITGKEAR